MSSCLAKIIPPRPLQPNSKENLLVTGCTIEENLANIMLAYQMSWLHHIFCSSALIYYYPSSNVIKCQSPFSLIQPKWVNELSWKFYKRFHFTKQKWNTAVWRNNPSLPEKVCFLSRLWWILVLEVLSEKKRLTIFKWNYQKSPKYIFEVG